MLGSHSQIAYHVYRSAVQEADAVGEGGAVLQSGVCQELDGGALEPVVALP